MIRWTFHDPVLNVTLEVPFNPNTMSSPYVENQTTPARRSPIDGRTRVVRASSVGGMAWQFGGVTQGKAHYDALVLWAKKPNKLLLTDHLGRGFSVRFLALELEPKNTRTEMGWKYRYTMRGATYGIAASTVYGLAAQGTGLVPVAIALTGVAATGSGAAIPGALI